MIYQDSDNNLIRDPLKLGSTNVHLIAINGIGMSALAKILFAMGYNVSGSDISMPTYVKNIVDQGAKVFLSHSEENISCIDNPAVIVSSIIKNCNPELEYAIKKQYHIFHRSDVLRKIAEFCKRKIVFSGTHGKTTSTSLCIWVFEQHYNSFLGVSGGIMQNYRDNIRNITFKSDKIDYAILEGDESDNSFIKLNHDIAVINNINPEHLDFYKTFDNLKKSVCEFIFGSKNMSIFCINDENLADIVANQQSYADQMPILIAFGKNAFEQVEDYVKLNNIKEYFCYCNIRATESGMIFDLTRYKNILIKDNHGQCSHIVVENFRDIYVNLYGQHNVINACGVFIVALLNDVPEGSIRNGFSTFLGAERRFTILSEGYGVTVVDDYAHHPNEIAAVINAARIFLKNHEGRVIVVVQPHKYSRLNENFDSFVDVLSKADGVIVLPVYAASELPLELNSLDLFNRLNSLKSEVFYCEDFPTCNEKLLQWINEKHLKNYDIVIFVGAGDVTYCAKDFAKSLEHYS